MKKLFAINKNFLLLVSLSSCFALFSQKYTINSTEFPEKLTENANSIIINQNTTIEIKSINDMVITKSFTICVLNELGLKNIDAVEYYDKSTRINSIEAFQFDQYGKEIKKYKRKDFRDQSVADGFSIYTDNRVLYLNFTPIQYPFTIIFNSQVETSNTAFIPTWYPINDWNESVVKSSINIQYPEDLGFKFKAILNDNPSIESNKTSNSISFVATNLTSLKPEDFSPSLTQIAPRVLFGLNNFNIEGIVGQANTWEDFGIWRYKTFLSDNEEVSVETQEKIKALVGFETDPIKKAKIVYQYVQDKTRYVSIQLGIGGWKPMPAIDVDRLGYGDCKALTNYTRVLLNVVNVPSFYTVIYGDSKKINFQEDFVSMQGNHIILSLPINDKLCFLECTSQTVPFGFGGNFTDDRYALIVKPTGGEIIKTNAYVEKDNSQITSGQYTIDEKGSIKGQLTIESKGVRYSNKFGLEKSATDATINFYKSCFDNISNLKIENTAFENNRESVQFLEKIKLSATNYGISNANQIIFPLNAFNNSLDIPTRYRSRLNPFEIQRGSFDEDTIEISLPDDYQLEAKPNTIEIIEKFGTYKMEVNQVNPHKLVYNRSFLIKKGYFEKTDYDSYRKFIEQIAKADNSKIIIIKK